MLDSLDQIRSALESSTKYRFVCDETLERVAAWSMPRSRTVKEAVKRSKRKLHQICASFLDPSVLEVGVFDSDAPVERTCRDVLRRHASTRERLDVLDRFYADLFNITGIPKRVLDLGCGLHPFGMPWMKLPHDTHYIAWDIDTRLIRLLNHFFACWNERAEANARDVLTRPPEGAFDLVFLLKTLPTLEQQERGASFRLLQQLAAKHIVISFPTASLSGREKGMRTHYSKIMDDRFHQCGWHADRLDFPKELVYIVEKRSGSC